MSEIKIPKHILVPINKLDLTKNKVKIHSKKQLTLLTSLIKMVGFTDPVMIDKKKIVWAGKGSVLAAQELGMKEVPCVYMENLTTAQKKAYMLLDNRVNESDWHGESVTDILSQIPDFDFKPFDANFDEFVHKEIIQDEIPPVPKKTSVKTGDMFQLGKHKIICGDCTNKEHYQKLMDKTVDCMVSDPPYNVDYAGKNKYLNTIGKGNRIETPITNDKVIDSSLLFNNF